MKSKKHFRRFCIPEPAEMCALSGILLVHGQEEKNCPGEGHADTGQKQGVQSCVQKDPSGKVSRGTAQGIGGGGKGLPLDQVLLRNPLSRKIDLGGIQVICSNSRT